MSQNIDLQAQMAGESDRAYLAYTTYRDMPLPRSELGAYTLYVRIVNANSLKPSKKILAPSPSYRAWVLEFRWAERVKEWDDRKTERIKAAQVEKDTEIFKAKIEDMRSRLERCGIQVAKNAESQFSICSAQFQAIAGKSIVKLGGKFEPALLDKANLAALTQVSNAQQAAINSLASAQNVWREAMGLTQVIDEVLAKHFGQESEEDLPPMLTIRLSGNTAIQLDKPPSDRIEDDEEDD